MIIKQDFIYTPKGKNRPLHIWLPKNYHSSLEHYPVMYFFDGHNLFKDQDATYGKSWGMEAFLNTWSKDMILVGIECGHDGYERLSEYLPYPAAKGSHFAQFQPMGQETMDWIVHEIKPYIDSHFRTIPFRECTAIGGSSMGGLMALYAAVHYNQWFSKAACVSSAVGFCIRSVMKDMRSCPMSPDTRIFLSWGTHEAHGIQDPTRDDRQSKTYGWNNRIAQQARSTGATVNMFCQVGGYHCEAHWEKQVPIFMDFLWMA